jgi:outer membrane protein
MKESFSMKKSKLYVAIGLLALVPFGASANTLLDIYDLALKNDAQLKADKAGYDADKELGSIARAGLLPQINATYSAYDKSDTDITKRIPAPEATGNNNSKTTGWNITLTQPLFDLSAWYVYKQGQKLSEQAEAQFGADQQSLIVRVTTAYFNVLRSVDKLETTIAEQNAFAHQLDQVKQRFDVGLTAITDVHEAQAAYDSAVAATLEARGSLSISYEALEVLTGKAEDQIAPLSNTFPVVNPTPADRAEWVNFALKNNYNLKATRLGADAAAKRASSARAEHLPTVGATLGRNKFDSDGEELNAPFDRTSEGNSASIGVKIPIFSGLRTSSTARQAVAQSLQAEEQFNSTQRGTIQNARTLHLSVETDVARVTARKQATVSNQSALEATQAGYEVGTRNLVEVLQAQSKLYQARRDYANALYDYVIDTVKLREVAGMLTPADVQEVDKWLQTGAPVSRANYEK